MKKTAFEPIPVEVYDFTKEIALEIGKMLWVDIQPLDVAYEKYKGHFGCFGDFLIVTARLARHKDEITSIIKQQTA